MTTYTNVTGIIVNYNSGQNLCECIQSLINQGLDRIIIVDNNSNDSSFRIAKESFPAFEYIGCSTNWGFGKAVNIALAKVTTSYVLICNPDATLIGNGLVEMFREATEYGKTAIVAPNLVRPNGTVERSGKPFPTIKRSWRQAFLGVVAPNGNYSKRYHVDTQTISGDSEVDWVNGACFLALTAAMREVGGFDEEYFMYVEEVDLCWRLKELGWHIRVAKKATCIHVGAASADKHPIKMALAHHKSLIRFAKKTSPGIAPITIRLLGLGVYLRLLLVILKILISSCARNFSVFIDSLRRSKLDRN